MIRLWSACPLDLFNAQIDEIEATFQAQMHEIEARMAEKDMVMRQFLHGAITTAEFASFHEFDQARISSVDGMTEKCKILDTSPVRSGDNIASLSCSASGVYLLDAPLLVATPVHYNYSVVSTTQQLPQILHEITSLSWSIRLITSCWIFLVRTTPLNLHRALPRCLLFWNTTSRTLTRHLLD